VGHQFIPYLDGHWPSLLIFVRIRMSVHKTEAGPEIGGRRVIFPRSPFCPSLGDAENARPENDGQRKLWVWKMQVWKMTDRNYGVWKAQDWKMTDNFLQTASTITGSGKCRTGK